jgi:hypothetical protein
MLAQVINAFEFQPGHRRSSWFFSVPQGECRYSALKYATTAFSSIVSISMNVIILSYRRWLSCGLLRLVVWWKFTYVSEAMIRLDDGGSKHLWNVGKLLPDCTAQQQPEDSHLHTRRRENLKYYPLISFELITSTFGTMLLNVILPIHMSFYYKQVKNEQVGAAVSRLHADIARSTMLIVVSMVFIRPTKRMSRWCLEKFHDHFLPYAHYSTHKSRPT